MPSSRQLAGWLGRLSGERYPCEDCGCGCASATECWTHCCCHSEHQRLVWAIENGVAPPAGVVFSDEQWIAAANSVKPGSATCGLCVARIKAELRQGKATPRQGGSERSVASGCCGSKSAGAGGACRAKACDGSCGGSGCDSCGKSEHAEMAVSGGACCGGGAKSAVEHGRRGAAISALTCKGLVELLAMTLPTVGFGDVAAWIVPEPAAFVVQPCGEAEFESRNLEVPEPPPRIVHA